MKSKIWTATSFVFPKPFLAAATLACLSVGGASSDLSRPMVFVVDGNVWSYASSGAASNTASNTGLRPQRQTSWAHNWGPSLSPNNRYLVYSSDARAAVETCDDRDDCGEATLPANIWLRNLNTNRSSRIADQPAGHPIKNGVQRSRPIWSPDGGSIAWTEILGTNHKALKPGSGRYRLAVYSLASRATNITNLDVPLPGSGDEDDVDVFVPDPVIWGAAGKVLPVPTTKGGSKYNAALLINANGTRRLNYPYESSGWLVFAKDGDQNVIAGHDNDFVINLTSGVSSDKNGSLEAFVPGRNGLSVVGTDEGCELYRNGQSMKSLPNSNDDLFGCDTNISPDGSQVAYEEDDALVIDDGRRTTALISGKDYVAAWEWGKLEYRIKR
jgi:WD40-like Beta Propeller Repeat